MLHKMIFFIVSISGLVWSFSFVSGSAERVTGSINGTVTLPCRYSTSKGTYTMCWDRGRCSNLQIYCTNKIIETDGGIVTWRKSDRYQLAGNVSQGNVSLTITGATKDDEGTYCCRVEVKGLFNDKMTDVTLKIKKDKNRDDDRELQTSPPIYWTFTTSTQTLSPNSEPQNKIEIYIFLICVILPAVLLAVVLYIYKFKKRKAPVRTGVTELNNLSSPVNQRAENVYIMD